MKAKRLLAGALSLTMSLALLAGCGGGNANSSAQGSADAAATGNPEDEACTLRISWWGGDGRHSATEAAIAAFQEKYPNITVDTEFGAWTGWEESVSTQLMSGTSPDVMQINWNWIAQYSPDGSAFYDLNQVSDVLDLTQFPEAMRDKCKVGDSLQAVPIAVTGRVFYWDKTTFDEAGIATPTTLAELMEAGEAFKTKLGEDYYPLALGEYDRMILMVTYLESKYGKNWVEDGAVNYTQQEVQDGLEFIKSLEDAHVTPTLKKLAGDGADSLDKNQNWIDGHYAGIFEWDSSANKFVQAAEGREVIVGDFFPDMGEYQGGFTKVSMGFAISANSAHPRQAALLIQYLLNEEEGAKIMASERGVPLSTAGYEVCQANDLLDAKVAEANGKVVAWAQYDLDPLFEDNGLKANPTGVYYKVMAQYSYGEMDSAAAAESLIKGITEVLTTA